MTLNYNNLYNQQPLENHNLIMDNCKNEEMYKNNLDGSVETTKLVIVGAGIAGLGAALRLEQSNFKDYILLEAQSEVGGRIRSIPWGNGWIELGAQFLHGTDSALGKLVEDNGLLGEEVLEGQGLFLREDGSVVPRACVTQANKYVKKILENCEDFAHLILKTSLDPDETIGNVLESKYQKLVKLSNIDKNCQENFKEELLDWNVRFLAIDNACTSLNELSVEKWGDYQSVGGPENSILKTYYGSIVEQIAGDLTQENIRLNCPVKRIEWNDQISNMDLKPITVILKNGNKIVADCVIVTCSLGYLKENLQKLFSPSLPMYYSNVIENMGFGVINKVFLEFDSPWWEPKIKGFQFLWSKEANITTGLASWTRDLTGFDILKNHPNTLVGWVGRRGAKVIEELDEEVIIQDCAKLFRYFLKNDQIPEASKCVRTSWGNNKYIRGAYCHLSKKCEASGGPIILSEAICRKIKFDDGIMKRVPILMFAGEATHPSFFSTTHGAYDTGIRQAGVFLRDYFDESMF